MQNRWKSYLRIKKKAIYLSTGYLSGLVVLIWTSAVTKIKAIFSMVKARLYPAMISIRIKKTNLKDIKILQIG
jgi:hypothetical protein